MNVKITTIHTKNRFGSADPADSMGAMRLQQMEFDMQKELSDLEAQEEALDRQKESVERQNRIKIYKIRSKIDIFCVTIAKCFGH